MRTVRIAALAAACVVFFQCSAAFAQAPGEPSAVRPNDCDRACLIGFVRGYMDALAHRDPARAHFAADVRFTENNVEMPMGRTGLWATISAVPQSGMEAADASTGEAAWIGIVEEHGLPVYYGMRLQVRDKAITQVETVVVRQSGLPLPFGDVSKLKHDPAFNEVLPPEQRRPRERLISVANAYFSTVELNDGVVFAPFDPECERTENGLYTTKVTPGSGFSSATFAQGCENQFKLGIYRINKRVRERRYPLVDVERGIVVATGFFDHANEFDTYKTTDGKEHKTLLKWPNSISLVEAFKIRDGRIYRIEAIFTYVPYFMHSPFYAYPAVAGGQGSVTTESPAQDCDSGCLDGLADAYMNALVKNDPSGLPFARQVRFTENSVALNIGEGAWGSVRAKSSVALKIADPGTNSIVWYGTVSDHDAPAYFGMRLTAQGRKIADVETVIARARNPGPFGDPAKFKVDAAFAKTLPAAQRTSREALAALTEGYAKTVQMNDGTLHAEIDRGCSRVENGAVVTSGKGGSAVIVKEAGTLAKGCAAQLAMGLYKPVDQVRARRVLAVDEERGLIVTASFADFPLRETQYQAKNGKTLDTQDQYPSSRELFEIFKVAKGRIEKIEAISVFQPLSMPSPWLTSSPSTRH